MNVGLAWEFSAGFCFGLNVGDAFEFRIGLASGLNVLLPYMFPFFSFTQHVMALQPLCIFAGGSAYTPLAMSPMAMMIAATMIGLSVSCRMVTYLPRLGHLYKVCRYLLGIVRRNLARFFLVFA